MKALRLSGFERKLKNGFEQQVEEECQDTNSKCEEKKSAQKNRYGSVIEIHESEVNVLGPKRSAKPDRNQAGDVGHKREKKHTLQRISCHGPPNLLDQDFINIHLNSYLVGLGGLSRGGNRGLTNFYNSPLMTVKIQGLQFKVKRDLTDVALEPRRANHRFFHDHSPITLRTKLRKARSFRMLGNFRNSCRHLEEVHDPSKGLDDQSNWKTGIGHE